MSAEHDVHVAFNIWMLMLMRYTAAQTVGSFLMCATNVTFALVVVSTVSPAILLAIIPLGFFYLKVQVCDPCSVCLIYKCIYLHTE